MNDAEAGSTEFATIACISPSVRRNFLMPERIRVSRQHAMFPAPVPKTSIDEEHDVGINQYEVDANARTNYLPAKADALTTQ